MARAELICLFANASIGWNEVCWFAGEHPLATIRFRLILHCCCTYLLTVFACFDFIYFPFHFNIFFIAFVVGVERCTAERPVNAGALLNKS